MSDLILALLLSSPALAQTPEWDARITEVEGTQAYVYPDGGEEGVPAEVGTPLEPGDRVSTGKKSQVEVALDPDSLFEIGPTSTFTVDKPEEEGLFAQLSLASGRLMAKIMKTALTRRFRVRTPTAVASVRGTEFGVEVGDDGETHVGVFDEGSLGVRPDEEGVSETMLGPGEETRVRLAGKSELVERDGARYLKVGELRRLKKGRERIRKLLGRLERIREGWTRMEPRQRAETRRNIRERIQRLSPDQRGRIREFQKTRSERLEKKRAGAQGRRGPARDNKRRPGPRPRR
ncbi:MAG: FecR domain-containing protein [Elusimicrobiota bacterium]